MIPSLSSLSLLTSLDHHGRPARRMWDVGAPVVNRRDANRHGSILIGLFVSLEATCIYPALLIGSTRGLILLRPKRLHRGVLKHLGTWTSAKELRRWCGDKVFGELTDCLHPPSITSFRRGPSFGVAKLPSVGSNSTTCGLQSITSC